MASAMLALLLALVAGSALAGPYVLVLGIAQDGGHPQAGCDAACCRGAWYGVRHRVASLGIVDPRAGVHFLVDATPDFPDQEHELEGSLGGIALTGPSFGHWLGLAWLGREAMDARAVPVWAMDGMARLLRAGPPWSLLVERDEIDLQALPPGREVMLTERLTLTAWPVERPGAPAPSAAIVVRGPDRSVLYVPETPDWSAVGGPGLEALLASVDAAWLDGTFFDAGELPDEHPTPHPTVRATLDRLADLPPEVRGRVRFTHLNHTNPLLFQGSAARDEVEAAGMAVAEEGERFPL